MGIIVFLYGLLCYSIGVAALLYAILFTGNLWVPKSVDSPPETGMPAALVIDLGLLALFAFQHSVMARPGFKKVWTRLVPTAMERSTYVLASGLVLGLLCWQWQPIPGTVWNVANPIGRLLLQAGFWLGWVILLSSTFMINHFDLFGLRQVYLRLKSAPYTPVPFVEVAFYRFIRHPIMLGLLIGFWSTPDMSLGHLVLAGASTGYILLGIFLEERDLKREHGATYEQYRRNTSMLLPLPRKSS
ncbi:MAG TPA: NnrU family protein [Gammaproteobacteria bacterium]|jgi:protein-S-isoprenylcysteine O-methyltransferase Ste14|nr:NnrU family protein [Gammaproteobacteria bacterium]